jgi:hypothetical protein
MRRGCIKTSPFAEALWTLVKLDRLGYELKKKMLAGSSALLTVVQLFWSLAACI